MIMNLSTLNPTPIYTTTLPSTGKSVQYRPFFVKEERALLSAYESDDVVTMLATLNAVVNSCMIVPMQMAIFDVEYMFLQIRAKSVEEFSHLVMECGGCSVETQIAVDLRNAIVEGLNVDKTIVLSPVLSIKMKYPSLTDVIEIYNGTDNSKVLGHAIVASIDTIFTKDESLKIVDEPIETVNDFIDTLTGKQFAKLETFIHSIPTVSLNADWTCPKCKHKNIHTLRGVNNCFE